MYSSGPLAFDSDTKVANDYRYTMKLEPGTKYHIVEYADTISMYRYVKNSTFTDMYIPQFVYGMWLSDNIGWYMLLSLREDVID